MSLLDDLTQDQRNMIISLPYRVGLWISQSDTAGGEKAVVQELQVLSDIIEGFSSEVFGSELVQHIMHGTLLKKDEWASWTAGRDSILEDCKLAVEVLHEHTDQKDVKAFAARLNEIAEAVALAFREYEEAPVMERMFLYVAYFKNKTWAAISKTPHKTLGEFLSISHHERGALGDLAKALDV